MFIQLYMDILRCFSEAVIVEPGPYLSGWKYSVKFCSQDLKIRAHQSAWFALILMLL